MSGNRRSRSVDVSVPVIPLNDEVWTRENVASFLKLDDPNQVYELTRKRNRHPLPVHRVGKQMRFSKAEVIAWFYEKAA